MKKHSFDNGACSSTTTYDPPSLRGRKVKTETQYFDFHRDLFPEQAAALAARNYRVQGRSARPVAAVIRLDSREPRKARKAS